MATFFDSTPKFRYKPLDSPDSIRILLLHPAPASSVNIHCDLIYTTASACDQDLFEHYVALSYVWGSTDDLQTIFLENRELKITRNLSEALHNLREEKRAIRLWADAICINQQDDDERNQQVSLMGQIYSIARHTIIYLGHSTPVIDALLQHTVEPENRTWPGKDQGKEAPEDFQTQLMARELLDRAWFTRIWVFQELVLSRDPWVQCGKSRLKWASFCGTLLHASVVQGADHSPAVFLSDYIMPKHHNSKFEQLRSLDNVRTTYRIDTVERQGVSELTLVDLVRSRRGFGVTDPRDIIYGHMGLVGMPADKPPRVTLDGVEFLLKAPEYEKSVEDVFMDFAHDMIEWYGHLGTFSYKEALCPSERMPNLGTWAPDWSVHPLKQPQTIGPRQKRGKWHPSKTISRPYSWIPNSRLLLTSAETIGPEGSHRIHDVSRVIPWNASDIVVLGDEHCFFAKDIRWFLDNFWRWNPAVDSASQCNGEEGWCTKLYWEIYGRYSEALGPKFLPEIEFRTAFDLLIPLTNTTDLIEERSFDSWRLSDLVFAHAFQVKERSILAGRRVASLAGGRIALVPPIAQAGDFIYQLDRESEREWDSTFVSDLLARTLIQRVS
jgi:hypothetical protein